MTSFSPREIVSELDRHIIGQRDAKRAVAIALRNRWRRQQLDDDMREEVLPKNILMIGPTGVGKTEISRRLAKLAGAPFIKVEATKFTEVGYVGRDVDQIVRDLLEAGIGLVRDAKRKEVAAKAQLNAEERVLDALVGSGAALSTREAFRKRLRTNELNDREIEIQVADTPSMPSFEIPGMPGSQVGMINLSDMLGKAFGARTKPRKVTVRDSFDILLSEESDKLIDNDMIVQEAIKNVENNGIVFLDEIDKICARSERVSADVSREGVQRDLLPLIEGTTVGTKYGPVKTDHILFIASGAFHIAKPSDLLPELQGRLPIRVELRPLPATIPPHPHRTEGVPHQAICRADEDRRPRSRIHPRRDRRHRRHRGGGEHGRREYRRAAPVHGDGAHSRGHLFRRSRQGEREDRHRRRLRARPYRRPRQERRPLQVHSLGQRFRRQLPALRCPEPHIERASAAEPPRLRSSGREWRDRAAPASAAPPDAARRVHRPRRASPRVRLGASPGDDQHMALAFSLGRFEEAPERGMRLALAHAMEVEPRFDREPTAFERPRRLAGQASPRAVGGGFGATLGASPVGSSPWAVSR